MTQVSQKIEDLLHRRSDLSTFVVHWTRDANSPALANLVDILDMKVIEARSPFGVALHAIERLYKQNEITESERDAAVASQRVVCFTETPLEQAWSVVGSIEGRKFPLAPYGIAFTKKQARSPGVNPIWYLDSSAAQGKEMVWPVKHVEKLVEQALTNPESFSDSPISKLSPLMDVMGNWSSSTGNKKEFWWEREWRHLGDVKFSLDQVAVVFCPAEETETIQTYLDSLEGRRIPAVDARWGLEHIIATLAGVEASFF